MFEVSSSLYRNVGFGECVVDVFYFVEDNFLGVGLLGGCRGGTHGSVSIRVRDYVLELCVNRCDGCSNGFAERSSVSMPLVVGTFGGSELACSPRR